MRTPLPAVRACLTPLCLGACLLLNPGVGVLAQPTTQSATRPAQKPLPMLVHEVSKGPGGDLAAVAMLEQAEADVPEPERDLWMDMLATRLIFVGDHRKAMELNSKAYAQMRGNRGDSAGKELEGYQPAPAVETILKLAEGRRVVMLNEEHRSSRERAFAHEVLEPLRQAGFTHLALETIGETGELNRRKYPLLDDGFYTRDPILGDLVRRALELGMGIVEYEADMQKLPAEIDRSDPIASTNWRERQQAENLARFVKQNPEARVIVWSGRHHMSEDEAEPDAEAASGSWTPMGGIFRQISGIDPLTVDLMVMNELARPELEHGTYRWAEAQGLLDAPTMFVNAAGEPWSPIPSLDAAVFFPRTEWRHGRPAWLEMGGIRRGIRFDWSQITQERPAPARPLLVEVHIEGEAENAVPLDRVIWREGDAPRLFVRNGKTYQFLLKDAEGNVLARTTAVLN